MNHSPFKIIPLIFLFCKAFSQNDTILYSFFSAGHTYGDPNKTQYGLYPPFVNHIPQINSNSKMELGFLTGDVVVHSTKEYWDSAMADINKLSMPTHIAAGNHDIGLEFSNRFQYYYDFVHKNDLFIILTPGLDSWNISGNQLEFLKKSLDSNHYKVKNIFIFLHELIWWSPTNKYKNVNINYPPYYPGYTNFDETIKPLLLSYENNITIYAGDLGANYPASPFMYDKFDNISLIGSGMGRGFEENIIVTNVYADTVYYDLISLNSSDPNFLGELYDYDIVSSVNTQIVNEITIYPSLITNFFTIQNYSTYSLDVNIYNSNGRKIDSFGVLNQSLKKINTSNFSKGLYIIEYSIDNKIQRTKIIVQ